MAKIELYDNQKQAVRDIMDNIDDGILLNVPTGMGKTYILSQVAADLLDQREKQIIISVPNNNLVKEMYDTIIQDNFNIPKEDVAIVIGLDNYINKNNLKTYAENGILEQFIKKESLDKYLKIISEYNKDELLLFSDFDKIVQYVDLASQSTVKEILKEENSSINAKRFEKPIIITNHFYIMLKVSNDENFNGEDFVFLFDEVHQLPSVAEQILEESFSLFELNSSLKVVEKLIKEEEILTTFYQHVKTMRVKATKVLKATVSKYDTGNYIVDINRIQKFEKQIETVLKNSYCEKIVKSIPKIMKNPLVKKEHKRRINYLKILINRGMKAISLKTNTQKGLYYSPSKGYPTIKTSAGEIEAKLRFNFWKKIKTYCGVSATLSYSPKPDLKASKYAYVRLGLYDKDRDPKVISYDRIFDKNLVNIFVDKEVPKKENIYDDEGKLNTEIEELIYYNYVADYVYKTFDNKNAIVLCGGYAETEFLYETFRKKYPEIKVTYSHPNVKTDTQLKFFKEEGGILFATRNYNTGISLEKKLLEKLYILSLPYPIFTNIRWLSQKHKNKNYYYMNMQNEMLISLMQTMGRLQRTKDDEGDIYLLDPKFNTVKEMLKEKIINILKFYGNLKTEKAETVEEEDLIIVNRRKKEGGEDLKEIFAHL